MPKRSPPFITPAKKDPTISKKKEIEVFEERIKDRKGQEKALQKELSALSQAKRNLEGEIHRLKNSQAIEEQKLAKYKERRKKLEEELHNLNEKL